MKKIIAIVGDAKIEKDGPKYQLAYETGKALVEAGFRIQSGGLRGVMEAAFKGAHDAENYSEGSTIAIIPSFDPNDANEYADIAIPTGLDVFRNVIVSNACAVVAIGGGAGTLSEIANAWALKRMIIAFNNVDGWSAKVAGTRMDNRVRYPDIPDDKIYSVSNAQEVVKLLKERLHKYNTFHTSIPKDS
ncbi:MAG: TIGR00725 family protein [Clostridiales bacterium]|nr:TIGR00725 family protein [Clostridiales bacterium]